MQRIKDSYRKRPHHFQSRFDRDSDEDGVSACRPPKRTPNVLSARAKAQRWRMLFDPREECSFGPGDERSFDPREERNSFKDDIRDYERSYTGSEDDDEGDVSLKWDVEDRPRRSAAGPSRLLGNAGMIHKNSPAAGPSRLLGSAGTVQKNPPAVGPSRLSGSTRMMDLEDALGYGNANFPNGKVDLGNLGRQIMNIGGSDAFINEYASERLQGRRLKISTLVNAIMDNAEEATRLEIILAQHIVGLYAAIGELQEQHAISSRMTRMYAATKKDKNILYSTEVGKFSTALFRSLPPVIIRVEDGEPFDLVAFSRSLRIPEKSSNERKAVRYFNALLKKAFREDLRVQYTGHSSSARFKLVPHDVELQLRSALYVAHGVDVPVIDGQFAPVKQSTSQIDAIDCLYSRLVVTFFDRTRRRSERKERSPENLNGNYVPTALSYDEQDEVSE